MACTIASVARLPRLPRLPRSPRCLGRRGRNPGASSHHGCLAHRRLRGGACEIRALLRSRSRRRQRKRPGKRERGALLLRADTVCRSVAVARERGATRRTTGRASGGGNRGTTGGLRARLHQPTRSRSLHNDGRQGPARLPGGKAGPRPPRGENRPRRQFLVRRQRPGRQQNRIRSASEKPARRGGQPALQPHHPCWIHCS